MGIHQFNTWLKKTYPKAMNLKGDNRYNHLYIDLNFMLHNSIYKSNDEKSFLANLFKTLDDVITKYIILESIIIAIDGPSPYSKINLQKKRRQQMANNEIDIHHLNSLHLTPGTKFMINLSKHIDNYINTRKKWFKYRNVEFYVYPTTEPGEGEIKLLKKLIENGNKNLSAKHLIVGNDADLVVMAMGLSIIDNIDILIKGYKSYEIIHIDKLIVEHCKKYCCLNFTEEYGYKILPARHDFAVLSIMMGNDYLPKLSFIKFNSLWNAYKKTRETTQKFLMTSTGFDIDFLKALMDNIILDLPIQFRLIDLKNYINYGDDNLKNYLEGVLWCYKMYNTGECKMYDYVFSCSKSPTPNFILFFLEKEKINIINAPVSDILPLDVYTCAILLLPKKAYKLLPQKYHSLVENELKKYYEMDECNTCFLFRKKLKALNDEIFQLKQLDKPYTDKRNKVKRYTDEYNSHKEYHANDFTIDKIRDIVAKHDMNKDNELIYL